MNLWDQPGVPHKGWTCEGVSDLDSLDGVCQMCGREEIRYVHHMVHADYPEGVDVGCVCAEKMEDDPLAPRARERVLGNAASRRRRWVKRTWKVSGKGSAYLNTDGFNVAIFQKPDGSWAGRLEEQATGRVIFSRRHYENEDLAKLGAFDGMIFLKSRGWGF